MSALDTLFLSFCIITSSFIAMVVIYKKYFDEKSFIPITIIGGFVFYNLGLKGVLALLFFVFSSLFWGSFRKKPHRIRNYKQVLANGFIPFLLSFFDYHLFLASLSAITSDTWSSEIGVSFSKNAYSLRGFKKVEAGESGAVSFIGTLGGILGALAIAFFSLNKNLIIPVFVVGFISNFIDSLMGAYLEKKYRIITSDFINFFISLISPILLFLYKLI